MWLRSSAFENGAVIPQRYTCEGEDLSPPLAWGDPPAGTRSFALLCDDPDAPAGTWHHWAIYDIPAAKAALPEGIGPDEGGLSQGVNDSGTVGWSGPCPPHGHGRHRYHFRLLALSVEVLPGLARPTCQAVAREARRHLLAEATLVGVFERR